ncbi:MAG TPA: hypothetical protein VH877_04185 [Polyangia bacterium]|jgi:hypothetical protein|nr:hypothetical protein [Polyangia bacterium]
MDNRVGDNAPNDAQMADLLARYEAIVAELKQFGLVLSVDERRRLLHARKDADEHVERVLDLAVKHGQSLPSIPLQGVRNDYRLAKALRPLADRATLADQLVSDTTGQAEHEYWQGFLAYYGVLSTLAQRLPELAKELEPVTKFMATGRRKGDATEGEKSDSKEKGAKKK